MNVINDSWCDFRAPAAGAAYPAAQAGYAVAPAATAAYGTQRAGYDQAYQAAATPGSFASKCFSDFVQFASIISRH